MYSMPMQRRSAALSERYSALTSGKITRDSNKYLLELNYLHVIIRSGLGSYFCSTSGSWMALNRQILWKFR